MRYIVDIPEGFEPLVGFDGGESVVYMLGSGYETMKCKMEEYEEPEGEEKPGRWRAEKYETYWELSVLGNAKVSSDCFCTSDNWNYISGNYFKTKEEVEEYREKLFVYNELKAYAEPDDAVWDGKKEHYKLVWDCEEETILVNRSNFYKEFGLYFSSNEVALWAVREVGEERVKRHYFGVKSEREVQ